MAIEPDQIKVLASVDQLADHAADVLLEHARAAGERRGRFVVAFSGGSTPRRLYGLLTSEPWRSRFDWSIWHVFWGDERVVPLDNPESNGGEAKRLLLDNVPVPSGQAHYVPVELGPAGVVAGQYGAELRAFFGSGAEPWPRFDLIFLGMGSDGHTASLFPGMPTLDERTQLVVASPPGVLPPPVDRVTFTLPVLNAARAVVFLVAGPDKRTTLSRVLAGDRELPAARVRPTDGELHWLVDQEAAPPGFGG
jgi:6-phosphogluconolactonase